MSSTRSRLTRLEAGHRQERSGFFLVYGATPEAHEAVLMAEHASGTLRTGDIVVCGRWTGVGEAPAPRWVSDEDDNSADFDRLHPQIGETAMAGQAGSENSDRRQLMAMTKVQLLAAALGRPLLSEPTRTAP